MDRLKLAQVVNKRWPSVAILVASGFVKLSQQDLPNDEVFVTKPYAPAEIAKVLFAVAPHA